MAERHDILWFDTLDSTNDEVRRRIDSLDNLSVVSAMSQTSGRGQRGNAWYSAPGENLTFSVLLKFRQAASGRTGSVQSGYPALAATDQFVISEITALSIVELLQRHEIEASIKWPNDIYTGEKKICGVLIENSLRGNYISRSIIGIGLNINQRNFDVNLPNPTSMLLELSKQSCFNDCSANLYDVCSLLDEFAVIFAENCEIYLRSDAEHSNLRSRYLSRLWRKDQQFQFRDLTVLPEGHADHPIVTGNDIPEGREFSGIIRGLSPIGNILIEDIKANSVKEFAFKEIFYIL